MILDILATYRGVARCRFDPVSPTGRMTEKEGDLDVSVVCPYGLLCRSSVILILSDLVAWISLTVQCTKEN